MMPLGRHVIADIRGGTGLDDSARIETALRAAAQAAGVTVLEVRLHHFGVGCGVTGVALLAESHISIHTWPEHALAAVDIFVCGPHADADAALADLCARLGGQVVMHRAIDRLASSTA
jgi:S-adenosylmethionine decarboxylase